jgi:hypothetical protein
MTTDMFRLSSAIPGHFFMHDLSPVCNQSNMTGATNGAATVYPFGVPEFIPGFGGIRVARFLVFYVVFVYRFFRLFVFFLLGIMLSVLL